MKSLTLLLSCVCVLSSCQPDVDPSVFETRYAPGHAPQGYVTLPGQAPVGSGSSSANAAFDQAVNRPYAPQPSESYAPAAPQQPTQPSYNQNSGSMDYTVKITNTTGSRLFIEAQDAKGTIYPCGHTQPRQSHQKSFKNKAPIASPILVVVRDPDQPNAPELRRYRISAPNLSYDGRTVQISIISGGLYSAAVDGTVYAKNSPND